jgi:hypothetical protein
MKNIYYLLLVFCFSFMANAQIIDKHNLLNIHEKLIINEKSTYSSIPQHININSFLSAAPIWEEDFANGIPASWTNSTAPWVYRGPGTTPNQNTGTQGAYGTSTTVIASATQSNGFIIFDSDYYDNNGIQGNFGNGLHPTPHNGELMTEMIDLTGYTDVTLLAHSYFRTFQGQAFVAFYVNGTYDSQVEVHTDLNVNDATSTDAMALVRLPLSVCNQANVQMVFIFDGTTQSNVNGSGYYFWMLDDLQLMETPAYLMDIVDQNHGGWDIGYANTVGFGMDYTFKPKSQSDANPYMFEMTIANVGANPLHGIQMNVEVLDDFGSVVFTSSSDSTTLPALDTANYLASAPYAPANLGLYDMRFWASSDSIPSSANSDTTYMNAFITDTVYGRDYNNAGSSSWRVGRECGGLQLGNHFDIYTQDTVTSVSAYVTDYSVANAKMYGVLYEYDTTGSGSYIPLAQTDDYVIQPQDRDNWVTIGFPMPYTVIPGHYMIAIGGYAHPIDTFGISVSGDAEITMSRILDDGSGCNLGSQTPPFWYWIGSTPMIRMNLGQVNLPSNVSEEFFAGKLEIFPNPSTGSFLLEMAGVENDIYHVEVTNLLGEQVYLSQHRISNGYIKQNINLDNYPQGTYLINISNSSNTLTEKLIIH